MEILESQDTSTTLESTQRKRSRKRTSRCWDSFDLLPRASDGKNCAKCKKCGKELFYSSTSGTRNLLQHHDSCLASGISPRSNMRSPAFSYDRFCELVIEGVVKHDLPFNFVEYEGIRAIFNYVSPELRLPSRNTVKNHITRLYEIEKSKMKVILGKAKGRICLTSDLWSSHTSDGYLSLTAHFIDTEWKLQKRLLNFCHMPPPHTGSALAEKINTLICEWKIDTNLFSITLDNASANNSCVDMLKTQLNLRRLLLLNGQYSILNEAMGSENDFIKKMGTDMNTKFQKYWSDYSLTLGIAVVMDPRYKMRFVDWAYKRLYGVGSSQLVTFRNTLDSLYEAYVLRWSTESNSMEQIYEDRPSSQEAEELFQDFDSSCIEGISSSVKNELSSYLEDKNLERKLEIDVLDWWKKMQFKYPVLSRLASDILSIPVSTVASESAFSIGGRVIDQYRSSLLPETVEALLCVRDWLFEKKCEDSSAIDILAEDVLNLDISPENELA